VGDIIVVASGYVGDVLAGLQGEVESRADLDLHFFDPRTPNPFAGDLAIRLLSAGLRLLISAEDQMAWRRLVAEAPGLGEVRLKRILGVGDATYARNLRSVAEGDDVCARPAAAGDAVLAQFGPQDEVIPAEIVGLLAESLGIPEIDLELLNVLAPEGASAPPTEWFQRIVEGSEESARDPDEEPEGIPVYTIFGAKGLQAPIVFVANALTPCFVQGGDVADGIRRAYVSVTRAQRHLLVSAPLYLIGSTLAHKIDAGVGGLADMITIPAAEIGIELQQVSAEDLPD
jgi:UvrD-like helicase C-terminal domain